LPRASKPLGKLNGSAGRIRKGIKQRGVQEKKGIFARADPRPGGRKIDEIEREMYKIFLSGAKQKQRKGKQK